MERVLRNKQAEIEASFLQKNGVESYEDLTDKQQNELANEWGKAGITAETTSMEDLQCCLKPIIEWLGGTVEVEGYYVAVNLSDHIGLDEFSSGIGPDELDEIRERVGSFVGYYGYPDDDSEFARVIVACNQLETLFQETPWSLAYLGDMIHIEGEDDGDDYWCPATMETVEQLRAKLLEKK